MARKNVIRMDEQTRDKDVSGKVFIVTGANSGVGLETTRHLVRNGGHVIMACRRPDAGKEAAEGFGELKGSYDVMQLDLASLESVRGFAEEFQRKYDRLDGLACNAGLVTMESDVQRTADGFETAIGVSYFGHFLLTELLLDVLKKSAPSRIVLLSSVVHAGSPKSRPDVHLEDLNYHERKFGNFAAYAEAKVAMNLYALELAKRLEGTGVSTAAVHPGWARSNFGKGGGLGIRMLMAIAKPFMAPMTDSNEESAQTSLHCLLSDDAPKHSGAYFSQSSALYRDKGCKDGGWPLESPNPNARDLNKAKQLVDLTYGLVGLDR